MAGVRATLFKLLYAPHRVHRRTAPGFLPNCMCRIESCSDMLPTVNDKKKRMGKWVLMGVIDDI